MPPPTPFLMKKKFFFNLRELEEGQRERVIEYLKGSINGGLEEGWVNFLLGESNADVKMVPSTSGAVE